MLPRQTALTGKFKQSARLQGRAGGRMLLPACASECKYFSLYVILVGTQPEKEGPAFRGIWGSHSSGVRKFWFSLHQPKRPHICPASQTHSISWNCYVSQWYSPLLSYSQKSRCFWKGEGVCLRARVSGGAWCRTAGKRSMESFSFFQKRVQFNVAMQNHWKAKLMFCHCMKHLHSFTLAYSLAICSFLYLY